MMADESHTERIDWSLTTWEGARREQTRRWSRMSLTQIIMALEEMQALADSLLPVATAEPPKSR
jgi:hypothetical protein